MVLVVLVVLVLSLMLVRQMVTSIRWVWSGSSGQWWLRRIMVTATPVVEPVVQQEPRVAADFHLASTCSLIRLP